MYFTGIFDAITEDARNKYQSRFKMLQSGLRDYLGMDADNQMKLIIDKAMNSYREQGERQQDDIQIRRYNILNESFINPEKKPSKQIAREYYVHQRMVFRDIQSGIKDLMIVVFGIGGVEWPER